MPLNAPLVFIVGVVLGSFLNVVILRDKNVKQSAEKAGAGKTDAGKTPGVNRKTPGVEEAPVEEAGVSRGRSQCPFCRKTLTWPELIPILSFIFLRGRCRACHHQLSPQYPIVELAMGISALVLFTPLPVSFAAAAAFLNLISIALLVTLFVIDLRTLILPDIFIILLSVAVTLALFINYQLFTSYGLLGALGGAALGTGALALLWLLTRGRGIGLGDVKLMIPLGALLGPLNTAVLLFIAFVTGGAAGTFLLLTGRANMKTPVPFGPFLAGVAIIFILIPTLPQAIINIIF